VAGVAEGNPEIRLAPGEAVRIVFRNQDPGLTHDFVVPGLGATIEAINGQGSASVVLRAPERPGRYDYVCTPHARMMRGIIVVQ
jgi:plastocyanin